MNDREKIIRAIEKAKKQSEEYAQDRIIVPFKEADMILSLLKEQEEQIKNRDESLEKAREEIEWLRRMLKDQEPDASKFQYKYDHTDCLWYRDSRSKCPVTCSQYRDGWNDAMIFVFKNGAGYSPYKRR